MYTMSSKKTPLQMPDINENIRESYNYMLKIYHYKAKKDLKWKQKRRRIQTQRHVSLDHLVNFILLHPQPFLLAI